jgi:probable F420-dependent oxidoreductase
VVKVGMIGPIGSDLCTDGAFLRDYAGTIEECGVDSVWTVEHVIIADGYEPLYPYADDGRIPFGGGNVPMPDPLELLAYLGACSSTLLLGTSVVVAPLHSPAVLAKRASTLARLSDGRMRLGLGIGWQREEYAAVGVPYSDRGHRLEECIDAMRALWANPSASYEGKYWSFTNVSCNPRPREGTVPIVLGGNTDPAVRRAGRVGDGWFPYTISPDDFATQVELLRTTARDAGRDPSSIEITVWPGSYDFGADRDPAWVRRYVDAGADRLVFVSPLGGSSDLSTLRDDIARYQDDVIAHL